MIIYVKDAEDSFLIPLPNSLLFSSLSLWFIKRNADKIKGIDGIDLEGISSKSMREIRRTIKQMRKIHKDLYLVEVEDGNSTVRIKL